MINIVWNANSQFKIERKKWGTILLSKLVFTCKRESNLHTFFVVVGSEKLSREIALSLLVTKSSNTIPTFFSISNREKMHMTNEPRGIRCNATECELHNGVQR